MKIFFLNTLVVYLMFGLFNYKIDPAHRWHGLNLPFDKWMQDQILLTPINYDERLYVRGMIEKTKYADVLIMGSSRVLLIDQSLFKNSKILNTGLSGGTVEDYIAIWQLLLDQNISIKSLVIFIDPYIFNKNSGQLRWQTNEVYYEKFIQHNKLTKLSNYDKFKYYKNKTKQQFNEIKDLFSAKTLIASFQQLFTEDDFNLIKIVDLPENRMGRYLDGSIQYTKKELTNQTLEKVRDDVSNFITIGGFKYLSDWEFNEPLALQFIQMLESAKKQSIDIKIILPPYQHKAFQYIQSSSSYKNILLETKNRINSISNLIQFQNKLTFCDAFDPYQLNCKETDFIDAAHAKKECIIKILNYCNVE